MKPEARDESIDRAGSASETAAIALGGAIGASLRFALQKSFLLPGWGLLADFSMTTLLINLVGSLLLGMLFGRVVRSGEHPLLRPFLGVGVLGSFTTYSAFVAEASLVGPAAGMTTAVLFVLVSLLMGLSAFELGRRLSEATARQAHP